MVQTNRQRIPYSIHAHSRTKNVCISPSNFSFTHKASTHTCTRAFTHIGLLFVVGTVAAVVVAVAFVVVDAVFAVDELSSMLCFIPKEKTKHKKRKENELKMMVSLAAFFAFNIRLSTQPIG